MSKKASSRNASKKSPKSRSAKAGAGKSARSAAKPASKGKPAAKGKPSGKGKPAGKGRAATSTKARRASRVGTSRAATPSSPMRDRALAHAQFAHGMINKFAEGFGPEQVVAQAGACPNHLLWTLGHLASSASWTHGMITGGAPIVPEGYSTLFGMGSKPIGDPALYPSFHEVREAYESSFRRLVNAVEQLDDRALLQAPEQDSGGFISDKLDALNKLAWHEGWHVGQLSDLRRGLGLPNVF
ncbi:MAG: hypothetical protein RL689_61 [Planctomycetota bacterium]|jgi:hypothetical protein